MYHTNLWGPAWLDPTNRPSWVSGRPHARLYWRSHNNHLPSFASNWRCPLNYAHWISFISSSFSETSTKNQFATCWNSSVLLLFLVFSRNTAINKSFDEHHHNYERKWARTSQWCQPMVTLRRHANDIVTLREILHRPYRGVDPLPPPPLDRYATVWIRQTCVSEHSGIYPHNVRQ